MADFEKVLMERRSIRRFTDREVDGEILEKILTAVQWSPSWANTQVWEVVVVRDPAVKADLADAVPKANPANKAMAEAPVVLALCAKLSESGYYKGQVTTKFGDWWMFDLGIAAQSICLAAKNLGLGTVIVGLMDHARAAAAVGLPEGYELGVLLPLGYASRDLAAPKRKDLSRFVHRDRFSG